MKPLVVAAMTVVVMAALYPLHMAVPEGGSVQRAVLLLPVLLQPAAVVALSFMGDFVAREGNAPTWDKPMLVKTARAAVFVSTILVLIFMQVLLREDGLLTVFFVSFVSSVLVGSWVVELRLKRWRNPTINVGDRSLAMRVVLKIRRNIIPFAAATVLPVLVASLSLTVISQVVTGTGAVSGYIMAVGYNLVLFFVYLFRGYLGAKARIGLGRAKVSVKGRLGARNGANKDDDMDALGV